MCNAYKLRRVTLCSEEATVESETELVEDLMQRYRDALPLGMLANLEGHLCRNDTRPRSTGKGLPKTELQPADDLAMLAGEVFVSLWSLSGMRHGTFGLRRSSVLMLGTFGPI